jgi:hypothetical protein
MNPLKFIVFLVIWVYILVLLFIVGVGLVYITPWLLVLYIPLAFGALMVPIILFIEDMSLRDAWQQWSSNRAMYSVSFRDSNGNDRTGPYSTLPRAMYDAVVVVFLWGPRSQVKLIKENNDNSKGNAVC